MLSVSFFINNAKRNRRGKVPVCAKIYRSEQDKATLYTKVSISPSDWDGFAVLPSEPLHAQYNAMLEKMRADVLKQYVNYPDEPAASIKNRYVGRLAPKYAIGDLFREYIQHKLDDPHMANKDTRRTYETHKKAMLSYLRSTQLYFHDASDFAYSQGRILYQRILKDGKSVIYSNKLMWKLSSALEWGLGERKTEANMLMGFKLKALPKKRMTSQDYLTTEEMAKLISVEVHPRYDSAKVLATRQLFTGMAFVDAVNFDPENVQTKGGKKVLIGKRSKTGEEYMVPLDKMAEAVCTGNAWKARKLSNCTFNEHLKVLAGYAGIRKNVTTHMLRRSFAQAMRDSGISDEVVAKMLGHKDTRMLVFYSTISEFRVMSEFDRLAA